MLWTACLRDRAGLSQDEEAALATLDPGREPMFNVPAVVVTLLVLLALIHALLVLLLTPEQTTELCSCSPSSRRVMTPA
jgi:hypothetical protein